MKKGNKAYTGIIVLIFPLLVLGAFWAKASVHQNSGQQIWQIKIAGYDPRDPLYGHYIRYRFDWNMAEQKSASVNNKHLCMCLNRSEEGYVEPLARPVRCDAPKNQRYCESTVKVYKHHSRYSLQKNADPERYFIPEENSQKLDALFRKGDNDFRIEVMAHTDNSVSIRNLYIDDVPLEEYLRSLPADKQDIE